MELEEIFSQSNWSISSFFQIDPFFIVLNKNAKSNKLHILKCLGLFWIYFFSLVFWNFLKYIYNIVHLKTYKQWNVCHKLSTYFTSHHIYIYYINYRNQIWKPSLSLSTFFWSKNLTKTIFTREVSRTFFQSSFNLLLLQLKRFKHNQKKLKSHSNFSWEKYSTQYKYILGHLSYQL